MSNLASSPRMLVLMDNTSPVRGCRGGSTVTSLHTSFSRSAVTSCSLLWWMDGYPPVGQDSVCAIVNNCPQTQCEASIGGDQPYRRQRASWYAPLCRLKPYQSSGIAVSQLDAPSSVASSVECSSAAGNSGFSAVAVSCWCLHLELCASLLRCFSSSWMSLLFSSCSTMRVTRGAVTSCEFACLISTSFVGLTRPKPPSLGARARRCLSSFPGGLRPVRLGMSHNLMASPRGRRCFTMLLLDVLVRNVYFPIRPWVQAACAAWGWVCATSASLDTCWTRGKWWFQWISFQSHCCQWLLLEASFPLSWSVLPFHWTVS